MTGCDIGHRWRVVAFKGVYGAPSAWNNTRSVELSESIGRQPTGMRIFMTQDSYHREGVARRTLIHGAAWSVPVIAMAVGTPLAAASGNSAGDFSLDGSCGTAGVVGPGFTLSAGSVPVPAGTIFTVSGSGVGDVGDFTVTGGTADVIVVSPTSRQIVLTAPLPAGGTVEARTTLDLAVQFTMSSGVILPSDYTPGPGAKITATVNSTFASCTAT